MSEVACTPIDAKARVSEAMNFTALFGSVAIDTNIKHNRVIFLAVQRAGASPLVLPTCYLQSANVTQIHIYMHTHIFTQVQVLICCEIAATAFLHG